MQQGEHILVVDDDEGIRRLLADYLNKNGYRSTAVAEGKAAAAVLAQSRVDLIVLDLMLPGEDGLTLCRNLRARSNIPIIILTARGEETDRIVGLEMGADDYVAKPFNPRELLARIKGVLRRAGMLPQNLRADDATRIYFAGWVLDIATRNLIAADSTVVALSGAEYKLLRVFLAHPNRVLSRDMLMDLTAGREIDAFERSIDVQISRLRQRLEDDAREPAIIKTVRGEGYVLAATVRVESAVSDA